jgi:hypothetical protein
MDGIGWNRQKDEMSFYISSSLWALRETINGITLSGVTSSGDSLVCK